MQLREKIETGRKKLKLTQAELARQIGCSLRSIMHWESGEHAPLYEAARCSAN